MRIGELWRIRSNTKNVCHQRITFFFLLEIPFSFNWVSCSSSSESESAFFLDAVSGAASSFLSFSWRNNNGSMDQANDQQKTKKNQQEGGRTRNNITNKSNVRRSLTTVTASEKLNFSKTFLNSSSTPSNSAFSGTYSTSTSSKAWQLNNKEKMVVRDIWMSQQPDEALKKIILQQQLKMDLIRWHPW